MPPFARRFARPRKRPEPGKMNSTEAKYAAHLETLKATGAIVDYRYESLKFRLSDRTFYTPDFTVITEECVELHEVKGFWEDDARVKIKVAADQYPWFKFVAIQIRKKELIREEF